jgi:hypothetical protein
MTGPACIAASVARRPPVARRAALVLACAVALAGRAEPAEPSRPPGTGSVRYVTAGRAYLDVGAAEGLSAGQELVLRRGGADAGRCRVEELALHHATCRGAAARPGDLFAYAPAPAPPAPRLLPAPPAPEELARRRAAVADAPLPLVEHRAPPGERRPGEAARRRGVEVALSHGSFLASSAGSSAVEGVDVALRALELGGGLLLDVEARAEHWPARATPRFRPDDDTRLNVWQAQLTAPAGRAVTLAAGRILPREIPGSTIFDGASATLRLGRAEVGLFGGAVPEPDTLAPTTSRAVGGAFWSVERRPSPGATLRHEARLAAVRSPELGTRLEATLAGRAYLPAVDASAEAQLGFGGVEAPGRLDAARADLAFRPARGVSLRGSFRHAGLEWPQPFEPPAFAGRTRAADLWAGWDVAPVLRLALVGGLARDLVTDLDRRWIGPEIGLPRLLGARGGLTVGYAEEEGWLAGRTAWAQLVARPFDRLRLVVRGSWAHDESLGVDRDEAGLYASAAVGLSHGLGLRLSGLGRTTVSGEGGSTPMGGTVLVTLHGSL